MRWKEDVRGTTGEKSPSILSCRVCCTMVCSCLNKPQMGNTWPQVKTRWGRVWWYLCMETTSTSSICSTLKHLPLWLISPSKMSAGHTLCTDKPRAGRLLGQHRGWDLDVITVGGNMVRAKAVSWAVQGPWLQRLPLNYNMFLNRFRV